MTRTLPEHVVGREGPAERYYVETCAFASADSPTAYIRTWPARTSYRHLVDVVELVPGLHFLRFPIGHAYLWQDPGGLTLIDTSVPGSAPLVAPAIRGNAVGGGFTSSGYGCALYVHGSCAVG